MVMDNDSGTYRPTSEHFPQVVQLMKKHFPDLHVICFDCTQDQPEYSKNWWGPRESKVEAELMGQHESPNSKASPRSSLKVRDSIKLEYPGKWEWKWNIGQK